MQGRLDILALQPLSSRILKILQENVHDFTAPRYDFKIFTRHLSWKIFYNHAKGFSKVLFYLSFSKKLLPKKQKQKFERLLKKKVLFYSHNTRKMLIKVRLSKHIFFLHNFFPKEFLIVLYTKVVQSAPSCFTSKSFSEEGIFWHFHVYFYEIPA